MNSKRICRLAWLGVLVLAVSAGAVAQNPIPAHFSGIISDYTPGAVSPAGPWKITGDWSLFVRGGSGTADFAAELTMVRSDYWIVLNPGEVDLPQDRTPHTHHITLANGTLTLISGGFEVTGMATINANGNLAGFSPSMVTIDVVGGTTVRFSNVKVTFASPASGHFGTYPLDGIVVESH